ncbi:MAG TPA: amidohydrolase family protein, partial [Pseudolabrys sp.]|nr:amidohydrolase family protein [Pseudolabrys sp.]
MSTDQTRRDFNRGIAALAATSALGPAATRGQGAAPGGSAMTPSMILRNGRITTLDRAKPAANAVAIADGEILAVGEERDTLPLAGPQTQVIDLGGRTVIPGLIDSHTHLI